jgi:hypothetical protein
MVPVGRAGKWHRRNPKPVTEDDSHLVDQMRAMAFTFF